MMYLPNGSHRQLLNPASRPRPVDGSQRNTGGLRDVERDLVLETLVSYPWEQNGGGAPAWRIGADTAEQDRRIFSRGCLRSSP